MKKTLVVTFIIVILILIGGIILISNNNNSSYTSSSSSTNNDEINRYSELSDIEISEDKINTYFFWGNGCQHCEQLFTFLENIDEKYKDKYNLYVFEVWYDNGEIMDYFLKYYGKSTGSRSVPFFIIGDELFEGYSSSMDDEIIKTTVTQYANREIINKFEDLLNLLSD